MATRTLITRLGGVLVAVNVVLVTVYLVHVGQGESSYLLRVMFDMDGEGTLPAWFSSGQMLLSGALLLFAATAGREQRPGHTPAGTVAVSPWFLAAVGGGFCFLSADEVVGIHETMTVALYRFEALPRFSGNHGMWIPVYVAAGGLFVAATAKHWLALVRADRLGTIWLVAGALLFLAGAAGLEILSYGDLRVDENRRLYTLQVAAEETVELFGTSAMLIGSALLCSALVSVPGVGDPGRSFQGAGARPGHEDRRAGGTS